MRSHADGSDVMIAMEASPGAEHAQGGRITEMQTVTGETTRGRDHTQVGTERDNVMWLVSEKERSVSPYIPVGLQHSEAKCAKQKKKRTRVSEHS